MQLPIQFTGLGHVNCYALEDDRGFALVDPGLPGPQSWDGLVDRLGRASIPLNRVHTIVVTHSHPDHFGGAARLRDETGADILTHRSFKLWWEQGRDDLDDTRPTPPRCPRIGLARRLGVASSPPSDEAMNEMRTSALDLHPDRPAGSSTARW
jgi:glyoxylase-like metal-dependent hydrolase (beta-lactamase superfamily II)